MNENIVINLGRLEGIIEVIKAEMPREAKLLETVVNELKSEILTQDVVKRKDEFTEVKVQPENQIEAVTSFTEKRPNGNSVSTNGHKKTYKLNEFQDVLYDYCANPKCPKPFGKHVKGTGFVDHDMTFCNENCKRAYRGLRGF